MANNDDWVSVKVACEEASLSRSAVDNYIAKGRLEAREEGRLKLVHLPTLLELAATREPPKEDSGDNAAREMALMARTAIQQNAELLKMLPGAWNALGIEPALKLIDVQHAIIAEQRAELEKLRQERRDMFETLENARNEESERNIAAAVASQEIENKQRLLDFLEKEIPRIVTARAVDSKVGGLLASLTGDQLALIGAAACTDEEQREKLMAVAAAQRQRFGKPFVPETVSEKEHGNE
jgi:hypothetical protein